MTAPRHLWSGDWQGDSAAAAEELAARRTQAEQPTERPAPTPPPRPRAQSPRARSRVRPTRPRARTRPRGTLLLALAMLVSAGVAFAGVLLLFGPSAQSSESAGQSARVSSRSPAWLGVDMAGSLGAGFLSPNGGVLVGAVVPGSPAAAAGLEPGDVITQIGSRPVSAPSDVQSAIAGLHAGDRVEIQYQRGPETYTTPATLAARPANP